MRLQFFCFLLFSYVAYSQQYSDFELKVRKDSLGTYLIAKNQLPCSTTFTLIKKEKDSTEKILILKSLDSAVVFKSKITTKEDFLDFYKKQYRAIFSFGDSLSSNPDKDYLYILPFQKKKTYKLLQSWYGSFSHNHSGSFHALDFKMRVGEPVHAAREGVVVRSIEHFTENGGREMRDKANIIIVAHKDGTFANYVHLKPKGSLVEIGQKISKGELIGYSGNTGFSGQPHLHFVVRDGNGKSIPVYFKNLENKKLRVGKKYTAE